MKILVIQQNGYTEVLLSTLLIEILRERYPSAEIHYLINTRTLPAIENNPKIDKFLNFTSVLKHNKLKFLFFLRKIKQQHYKIVVDAQASFNSALMTHFSGASRRIGFRQKLTAFAYTHVVSRERKSRYNQSLVVENRLKLLKTLHISPRKIYPKIYLTEEEEDLIETNLLNSKINFNFPLVMVDLLHKDHHQTYPKKFLVELLNRCVKNYPEVQFIFHYRSHQRNEANQILEQLEENTQKHIFEGLATGDLREFFALINRCSFIFGNQGLPAVAAKALKIPTFTISSPHILREFWFSKQERDQHPVMHPEELLQNFKPNFFDTKRDNPSKYYSLMTPELIWPHLDAFMKKWLKY